MQVRFYKCFLIVIISNQHLVGSYHANGIPEAMYGLAAKQGIELTAYNFNEAQHVSLMIFSFFFVG